MRDSIILYSPLNFVFTHTSPLVNKTNHIIENSGKKISHLLLNYYFPNNGRCEESTQEIRRNLSP